MGERLSCLDHELTEDDKQIEGQFLSLANEMLRARNREPAESVMVGAALVRAGLYVCFQADVSEYYHFLAQLLKTVLRDMKEIDAWARGVLDKKS
jgi:hypothetical protein